MNREHACDCDQRVARPFSSSYDSVAQNSRMRLENDHPDLQVAGPGMATMRPKSRVECAAFVDSNRAALLSYS